MKKDKIKIIVLHFLKYNIGLEIKGTVHSNQTFFFLGTEKGSVEISGSVTTHYTMYCQFYSMFKVASLPHERGLSN